MGITHCHRHNRQTEYSCHIFINLIVNTSNKLSFISLVLLVKAVTGAEENMEILYHDSIIDADYHMT